jgi:hypothetical protein
MILSVIGAIIFLVLKSDCVTISAEELCKILESLNDDVKIKISLIYRERFNWKESPSKEKYEK